MYIVTFLVTVRVATINTIKLTFKQWQDSIPQTKEIIAYFGLLAISYTFCYLVRFLLYKFLECEK